MAGSKKFSDYKLKTRLELQDKLLVEDYTGVDSSHITKEELLEDLRETLPILSLATKFIKELSDFPEPDEFGVIHLENGYVYELQNDIITPYSFAFPDTGTVQITGLLHNLIYVGGDALFKSTTLCTFYIHQIILVGYDAGAGAGKCFDFNIGAVDSSKFMLLEVAYIVGFESIGTMVNTTPGMHFVNIFDCGQGLSVNGGDLLELIGVYIYGFRNLIDTVFLKIYGSITSIKSNSCDYKTQANEYVFYFDKSFANNVLLTGNFSNDTTRVFAVNSWTTTDNNIFSVANKGINNSLVLGEMSINNNTTATDITALNTPVKIIAGWTITYIERFTYTTGRLTYSGIDTKKAHLSYNLTASMVSGTGDQNISVYVFKNGALLSRSKTRGFAALAKPVSLTTYFTTDVVVNDYFEIFIENNTGTVDIIVSDCNFVIES